MNMVVVVVEMVEAEAVPCAASGFVGEVKLIDSGLESVEFGFDAGFGDLGKGGLGADDLLLSLPAAATANKEDGDEEDGGSGDDTGYYFDP